MKHNCQHIIKKTYAKPVIEEVMIDVAINLTELSTQPPVDPDCPECPIEDPGGVPGPTSTAPKYSTDYQSVSPFGGSAPIYD